MSKAGKKMLKGAREALNMVRRIDFPGVNAIVICDCGHTAFKVGIEADPIGNNHIRCIECIACGHKLAVPFFDDGTKG